MVVKPPFFQIYPFIYYVWYFDHSTEHLMWFIKTFSKYLTVKIDTFHIYAYVTYNIQYT